MKKGLVMKQFKAIVIDKVGLHARPASLLAKEASKYQSDLKIRANGKIGNLKSIMNVMAMGIRNGAEIIIEASGADEEAALEGLRIMLLNNNVIGK